MRYTDVYQEIRRRGYTHNFTSTIDNLQYLVETKQIVKVLRVYGIPRVENGVKYLTFECEGQKATVKVE
jgi:hypothetical protein